MKNKMLFLVGCMMFHINLFAQRKVDIVKFDWYKNIRASENDTTYVLNFWASRCMPCMNELPEFEKLNSAYRTQKVKVILVNLDPYKKLPITIIPYLEKSKMQSEVVLLDEPNFAKWIHKVDKGWSGSIPATVIFNNKNHFYRFIEGESNRTELSTLINESLFEYK